MLKILEPAPFLSSLLIDGNALPDLNAFELPPPIPPIDGKLYYAIDVYDFRAGALSNVAKELAEVLVSGLFTTFDVLSVSLSLAYVV